MIINYEQDQEIIELFLQGKSQTEIAKQVGCAREWIRQRLERNGFSGRNYRWVPERENLLEVLKNAKSVTHAAQLLCLNDLQLQTAIKHHGATEDLKITKSRWKSQKRDEYYISRQRPLIIQVRELAQKIGHTPSQKELQANGISHMTLERTFGSLREAMSASGLIPNNRRITSPIPPNFGDLAEPTTDFDVAQQRANLLYRTVENIPEPEGSEIPRRNTITITSFYRDPKVAAWVLQFANGVCEVCGIQGYETDGGTSFLSTHHVNPLSEGGPDTIRNVVAVCETCHGKLHRWKNREMMKRDLYINIDRLREPPIKEKDNSSES